MARRGQYATSPQESEDEDRDEYTTPYCKRNSAAGLVDQVELVNLNNDGNYGAVWKSRPPSYSSAGQQQQQHGPPPPPPPAERERVDPPPPPPPQARNIHTLVSTDLSQGTPPPKPPAPPAGVGAKLAALTSFRPQEVHVYESPKFLRRDGEAAPGVVGSHHREIS